jgi:hypothetical protein
MPVDSGKFVLVRKVITDLAVESLLERVPQPLGKMFCSCRDNKSPILIRLAPHYLRERIINGCALAFIVQKALDLLAM